MSSCLFSVSQMLQGCRGGGRVGGGKREGKEDGEGTRGGRGATEHRRTRTDVIQFTNQSRASVQQGKFIFNSNEQLVVSS